LIFILNPKLGPSSILVPKLELVLDLVLILIRKPNPKLDLVSIQFLLIGIEIDNFPNWVITQ
jgi:hypothetical protein